MDLSKTEKWRDGNGNANADAKVSTIALPVLCTGELKMAKFKRLSFVKKIIFLLSNIFMQMYNVSPLCI